MTFSSRTLHIYPDLFGAVERNPDDSLLQDLFHDAVALLLFQVSNVLEDFKISLPVSYTHLTLPTILLV